MDSAAPPPSPDQGRTFLPMWLRALVRRSEFALIGLAVLIGVLAGLIVAVIRALVHLLHYLLFSVPIHGTLSALDRLDSPYLALVPVGGGLVLGLTGLLIRKWRPRRPIDPIEANALQGGRMSLIDSLLVAGQTIISTGVGGSVGTEAGFTQAASGFASVIGSALKLRRNDLRTLVGCGAAGGIGAAFGAPLTGAFYAFELIVGTYTPFGLAPIMASSIASVLVVRAIGLPGEITVGSVPAIVVTQADLVALFILALVCALIGIGIMRAVTFVEDVFKHSRVPLFIQPMIGGIVLGGLALVTPKALSSGHGALAQLFISPGGDLSELCLFVLLKSIASSVSIGSGYRGGLFFASLFLGGMIGKIFAILLPILAPTVVANSLVYTTVGMSALAVAIIGGPLTMSFLALEITGDPRLVIMVLFVSMIVSVIVRQVFGYSFATWRMHLRGESIRSAQDVGWMRALTVARMMKTDVKAISENQTISQFTEMFPLGSTQWVVAADADGRYAGLVSVTDAHLSVPNGKDPREPVSTILRHENDVLLRSMNIKQAAELFDRSEGEALAVVDDELHRRVVGMLTEAYVLRRYSEELEKARRALAGEKWQGEA